jgi:hypothetical protein
LAEIDHADFAADFSRRLAELGYSMSRAVEKWPAADRAMLSRAINGKTLSAGNFLLLCEMAGLDPYVYLLRGKTCRLTRKTLIQQAVTRGVPRETGKGC